MRQLQVGTNLYLWDGGVPKAYCIRRIDLAAYLLTDEDGEEKVISRFHKDLFCWNLVCLAILQWGY
jgi:hypothetical protein